MSYSEKTCSKFHNHFSHKTICSYNFKSVTKNFDNEIKKKLYPGVSFSVQKKNVGVSFWRDLLKIPQPF